MYNKCLRQFDSVRYNDAYAGADETQGFAFATKSYDTTLLTVYSGRFSRCPTASLAIAGHGTVD